jgi:uncharacterized membrane protein YidH (DUF202 family)
VTSQEPARQGGTAAEATLAGERTLLAWTRTIVAFCAIGVAVAKLRPLAGIPIVIFGAALWPVARPRTSSEAVAGSRARVRAVAAAITTVAVLSLLIVLAGRGSAGFRR